MCPYRIVRDVPELLAMLRGFIEQEGVDETEFRIAIVATAEVFPGGETAFWEFLCRELRISRGTYVRWREGFTAPHPIMRQPVLALIHEGLA